MPCFAMRASTYAILGVLAFAIAGFIHGQLRYSSDPQLIGAFSWGLAGIGLLGVIAGGVSLGNQPPPK